MITVPTHACEDATTTGPWSECWKSLGWSPLEEMAGKELSLSTTCTGIDTPVFASLLWSHGLKTVVGQSMRIRNVHACEKDLQCVEEILHGPLPPDCCFDNMLHWLFPQQVRELKDIPEKDNVMIREAVLGGTLRQKSWCLCHGGYCFLRHSDGNVSGTPCIHHSTFGKREGMQGHSNKVYYIWAKQRPSAIFEFLFNSTS